MSETTKTVMYEADTFYLDWPRSGRQAVTRVEVDRVTNESVYIDGRRRAKRARSSCYFESWQEAREWLVNEMQREIISLENRIVYVKKRLDIAESIPLEEPPQ